MKKTPSDRRFCFIPRCFLLWFGMRQDRVLGVQLKGNDESDAGHSPQDQSGIQRISWQQFLIHIRKSLLRRNSTALTHCSEPLFDFCIELFFR